MHKYRLAGVQNFGMDWQAFALQEYSLVHLWVVDFAVIDSTMASLIDAVPLASSVSCFCISIFPSESFKWEGLFQVLILRFAL